MLVALQVLSGLPVQSAILFGLVGFRSLCRQPGCGFIGSTVRARMLNIAKLLNIVKAPDFHIYIKERNFLQMFVKYLIENIGQKLSVKTTSCTFCAKIRIGLYL